jgi:hypothetical protein
VRLGEGIHISMLKIECGSTRVAENDDAYILNSAFEGVLPALGSFLWQAMPSLSNVPQARGKAPEQECCRLPIAPARIETRALWDDGAKIGSPTQPAVQ